VLILHTLHVTTAFAAAAVEECNGSLASQLAQKEPVLEPVPAVTPATTAPTAAAATLPDTAAASNTTAAAGGANGSGSGGSSGSSTDSSSSTTSNYDQFRARQYTVVSVIHYAVGSLLAGVLTGVLVVLCCSGLIGKPQRSMVRATINSMTNSQLYMHAFFAMLV
jgi:hypothetical protein